MRRESEEGACPGIAICVDQRIRPGTVHYFLSRRQRLDHDRGDHPRSRLELRHLHRVLMEDSRALLAGSRALLA